MGWANGVMFPIFVSICHFLSALICGHLPQVIFRVSSNARTKTLRRNLKTASSRTMSTYVDWNLVLKIEIHYRAMNVSSCVEKIDYQYVCVWSILGPRDHDLFGTRWKQRFWLHNVHFTMRTNNNWSLVLAIESTIWHDEMTSWLTINMLYVIFMRVKGPWSIWDKMKTTRKKLIALFLPLSPFTIRRHHEKSILIMRK